MLKSERTKELIYMFTLKDNKEIGAYLSKLIRARGYKSDRAFCKAYLEHEHREANDG